MNIEQRIKKLKERNEFMYDEDITFCIRSLEALEIIQKEIKEINDLKLRDLPASPLDCYFCELRNSLTLIDKTLKEIVDEPADESLCSSCRKNIPNGCQTKFYRKPISHCIEYEASDETDDECHFLCQWNSGLRCTKNPNERNCHKRIGEGVNE